MPSHASHRIDLFREECDCQGAAEGIGAAVSAAFAAAGSGSLGRTRAGNPGRSRADCRTTRSSWSPTLRSGGPHSIVQQAKVRRRQVRRAGDTTPRGMRRSANTLRDQADALWHSTCGARPVGAVPKMAETVVAAW